MNASKKIICLFFILFISFLLINSVRSQTTDVTLTWSADTYVPAGYPGRALPSRSSFIEVIARIEDKNLNPQKLTYNWFINNEFQRENSGKGKQILKFNIGESLTEKYLVRVELLDENNNPTGSSLPLSLKAYPPEIVLKAEKKQISANQEANFYAQPYFFNIKNLNGLSYSWKLGGQEAMLVDSATPNIFTLEVGQLVKPATRTLFVTVVNKTNPFQKAQTEIAINLIP